MGNNIYCCEKFKEQVEKRQIDLFLSEGKCHVYGCCGGGCYVLTNIIFCPFCGKKIINEVI